MSVLISIIIPTHNNESTITRCLNSIAAQSFTDFEVVVALDHCTDKTKETVLKHRLSSQINVVENTEEASAANARNAALAAAKGRFIAFLDADDAMAPDRLKTQLDFMTANNLAFTYSQYNVHKANGDVFLFKPPKVATYKKILKTTYIGCSTVMIDRRAHPNLRMATDAPKREDAATWLSILKTGEKAFCINRPLVEYFMETGSVSSSKRKMIKYQWNLLRRNQNINWFASVYYMITWAWHGFWKYRL